VVEERQDHGAGGRIPDRECGAVVQTAVVLMHAPQLLVVLLVLWLHPW
jgi:hypothetical protein